jgi:putative transposase
MKEQSIIEVGESRPAWEALEAYAREGIRRLLQHLLEEEMEEVLGRRRYARREGVDAPPGYRSGLGKPRRLSLMSGTITVRRPRGRGLDARFESRLLPLFKRRTEEVGRLLPELYLHGLAHGDFDRALRGLLGAAAPLSAASIARLKAVSPLLTSKSAGEAGTAQPFPHVTLTIRAPIQEVAGRL